jgi:group I intron endonuclease
MMKIDKCYIYVLTSPSGRKYVGQTINLNKRFEEYRNQRIWQQIKIFSAIKKYGWDNFNIEIIEFNNLTQKELDDLEIYYIKRWDSYVNGYNCTIGGLGKRVHYTIEERKLARLENLKRYREKNKEKIRKSNARYQSSNLGIATKKEYYEKYYSKNKKIIAEKNKQYINNNKEKHLERRRRYHLSHKEVENQRCRNYYNKKKLENDTK